MTPMSDELKNLASVLHEQQRSAEEALRRAMESLRGIINNAYERWEATGYVEKEVMANLEDRVKPVLSSGPTRSFGEALEAQRNKTIVMRAICLTYMGKPRDPWDYECIIPMGGKPYIEVRGYRGFTAKNVRDLRDVLVRRNVNEELPDSGFGF